MPLISVIIPAYNADKTIKHTIESVLNQTFADFELIIINDGSKDSTLEIISTFDDSRLKLFSYPNAGANVSRNRGIAKAKGEYISFIDADDLWTPDKLELQLKALQENPQAAVAYSWTNCIDELGNFQRRGSYIVANGNVFSQLLLINFLENGSNPLITRPALETIRGFDESLQASQDFDLYLRLAYQYHFICVPKPQILYRVSGTSMSSNLKRMELESIKVIQKAFAKSPQPLPNKIKRYSFSNIYKYLLYKTLEIPSENGNQSQAIKYLFKVFINDPHILMTKTIVKIFLNIVILMFFPPSNFLKIKKQYQSFLDTSTILGYLRIRAT
ncbi:MAG: glycosyltransferase [Xenococcaceae cyanobacterium]